MLIVYVLAHVIAGSFIESNNLYRLSGYLCQSSYRVLGLACIELILQVVMFSYIKRNECNSFIRF